MGRAQMFVAELYISRDLLAPRVSDCCNAKYDMPIEGCVDWVIQNINEDLHVM